jgi:SRR1
MPSGEPCLVYRTIQELTSFEMTSLFAPPIASCSLHVYKGTSYRNKLRDVVDSVPPEPCFDKSMVKDIFKITLDEWEKSKQCEDLLQVLQSADLSNVKQIVAFACGSMKIDPTIEIDLKRGRRARRSMYQHSLLLTIRKVLNKEKSLGNPISTWVQDPAYCSIDISILAESGVSILDNPDGFLKVDDSTMVLSFAPDVPIKQIITDISLPAAMIWDRVTEDEFITVTIW